MVSDEIGVVGLFADVGVVCEGELGDVAVGDGGAKKVVACNGDGGVFGLEDGGVKSVGGGVRGCTRFVGKGVMI